MLCTTHVRTLLEWCNGAIYHAVLPKVARLASVQTLFLSHLELDKDMPSSMATPLRLRRDIGMLNVLRKMSHDRAYTDVEALFPMAPTSIAPRHDAKAARRMHSLEITNRCDGLQLNHLQR